MRLPGRFASKKKGGGTEDADEALVRKKDAREVSPKRSNKATARRSTGSSRRSSPSSAERYSVDRGSKGSSKRGKFQIHDTKDVPLIDRVPIAMDYNSDGSEDQWLEEKSKASRYNSQTKDEDEEADVESDDGYYTDDRYSGTGEKKKNKKEAALDADDEPETIDRLWSHSSDSGTPAIWKRYHAEEELANYYNSDEISYPADSKHDPVYSVRGFKQKKEAVKKKRAKERKKQKSPKSPKKVGSKPRKKLWEAPVETVSTDSDPAKDNQSSTSSLTDPLDAMILQHGATAKVVKEIEDKLLQLKSLAAKEKGSMPSKEGSLKSELAGKELRKKVAAAVDKSEAEARKLEEKSQLEQAQKPVVDDSKQLRVSKSSDSVGKSVSSKKSNRSRKSIGSVKIIAMNPSRTPSENRSSPKQRSDKPSDAVPFSMPPPAVSKPVHPLVPPRQVCRASKGPLIRSFAPNKAPSDHGPVVASKTSLTDASTPQFSPTKAVSSLFSSFFGGGAKADASLKDQAGKEISQSKDAATTKDKEGGDGKEQLDKAESKDVQHAQPLRKSRSRSKSKEKKSVRSKLKEKERVRSISKDKRRSRSTSKEKRRSRSISKEKRRSRSTSKETKRSRSISKEKRQARSISKEKTRSRSISKKEKHRSRSPSKSKEKKRSRSKSKETTGLTPRRTLSRLFARASSTLPLETADPDAESTHSARPSSRGAMYTKSLLTEDSEVDAIASEASPKQAAPLTPEKPEMELYMQSLDSSCQDKEPTRAKSSFLWNLRRKKRPGRDLPITQSGSQEVISEILESAKYAMAEQMDVVQQKAGIKEMDEYSVTIPAASNAPNLVQCLQFYACGTLASKVDVAIKTADGCAEGEACNCTGDTGKPRKAVTDSILESKTFSNNISTTPKASVEVVLDESAFVAVDRRDDTSIEEPLDHLRCTSSESLEEVPESLSRSSSVIMDVSGMKLHLDGDSLADQSGFISNRSDVSITLINIPNPSTDSDDATSVVSEIEIKLPAKESQQQESETSKVKKTFMSRFRKKKSIRSNQ